METPKSRLTVNKYGQALLSSDNLRELLLQGRSISRLNVIYDEEIQLFNKYQADLLSETVVFQSAPDESVTFDEFHLTAAAEWMIPTVFKTLDVKKWLLDRCDNRQQRDRVIEEYNMYEDRDLIMLLRLFIYLVDYMRKNEFIWGVGRGSSVSSYILYLIGIHRVDSIKYSLPISDYLK